MTVPSHIIVCLCSENQCCITSNWNAKIQYSVGYLEKNDLLKSGFIQSFLQHGAIAFTVHTTVTRK